MPLVSGELAADVGAVNLRLALHILFAAAAADGSHVLHPEVIRISANGVNGLFEADFDFEPPAVEANNLQWVQGQIGAEEDHVAAGWVAHPDKADQLAQGPPQQVLGVIAEGDAGFPIDPRTFHSPDPNCAYETELLLQFSPDSPLSARRHCTGWRDVIFSTCRL